MIIKRDSYLNQLKNKERNGMIKVVTGLRRAGKSYLIFEIFYSYLKEKGIPDDHIIKVVLDNLENEELLEKHILYEYIKSQIKDDKEYYILLDEIQMVDGFSDVLNSLLHIKNADTYVTGSNSKFLSKDILTEFRGRGDEIHVFPLTFKEFMSAYDGDRYQGWADYTAYGGLPYILTMRTEREKINYLQKLFEETYLVDIMQRNNIKKQQEFEDLLNVLSSDISALVNPPKIQKTFKSNLHSDISINTIRTYIEFLEDAFLISKAKRYDVKGRKYIGTPHKYYFEDVGLRNARIGFSQIEENHIMENVIYNELRYRGYSVDVGMVKSREMQNGIQENKQLEVDFVANLGSKRYYIQSAYRMDYEEKKEQEKKSFRNINDSFKKIFVVKDVINVQRDNDGYTTMSIFDFLLDDNSLEL
ncbi:MAG: ATP-binding protein [Lachnospiraceae bacterium]|nr:ATP-binding protein [Lachnospiraceae bacterium]